MQALQFNVAQLLKDTHGAVRSYQLDDDISLILDDIEVVAPLRGDIHFTHTREGILVTGRLSTKVQVTCRRCAESYVADVEMTLEETFRQTYDVTTGLRLPEEDDGFVDEATLIDEHHVLDLSEVVRQYLILGVPPFPLCRPDCAGLCPHCGADLSQGPCACAKDEINPRWSALQDLLDKTTG